MAAIFGRALAIITLLHCAASDDADHTTALSTAMTTSTTTAKLCFDCPQNWTDPNTCGSCTFTDSNFCNWTNSKHTKTKWKQYKDYGIEADPEWKGEAVLVSPVMCHLRGDVICLKFRYGFSLLGNRGMLSVQVCHTNCTDKFKAFSKDSGHDWHTHTLDLTAEGNVQIRFIGNITEDSTWTDSHIFLNDIVYKRGSCKDSPNPVSTTTAEPTDPAGTFMTKIDFSTSSVSSRDQDNNTDWTTREPLVTEDMAEARSGNGSGTLWPDNGNSDRKTRNDTKEKTTAIVKIVAPVAVGLLLVILGTTIALVWRRRREKTDKDAGGPQQGAVQNQRNSSIVMVNNDLYYSMDMSELGANDGVGYELNRQSGAASSTSSPHATARRSTTTAQPGDRQRSQASVGGMADIEMATSQDAGTGNDNDVTYTNVEAVPADYDDEYSHLNIDQRVVQRRNTRPTDNTYDSTCV